MKDETLVGLAGIALQVVMFLITQIEWLLDHKDKERPPADEDEGPQQ